MVQAAAQPQLINTKPAEGPQRMLEIGDEEMWTPYLEEINELMIQEKKARQDNDSYKGAELCCKIVSHITVVIPWLTLSLRLLAPKSTR